MVSPDACGILRRADTCAGRFNRNSCRGESLDSLDHKTLELRSAVATAGGDRAVSPRGYSPAYDPLKAETRVESRGSHHRLYAAPLRRDLALGLSHLREDVSMREMWDFSMPLAEAMTT